MECRYEGSAGKGVVSTLISKTWSVGLLSGSNATYT